MNNVRDDKYLIAFGENLKKLRLKKKISRETLAVYANIETMEIYKIDSGLINTIICTTASIAMA